MQYHKQSRATGGICVSGFACIHVRVNQPGDKNRGQSEMDNGWDRELKRTSLVHSQNTHRHIELDQFVYRTTLSNVAAPTNSR